MLPVLVLAVITLACANQAVFDEKTLKRAEKASGRVFKSFDTNNDGQIEQQELNSMFSKFSTMFPSSAAISIEEADKDEDGMLNEDEFKAFFTKSMSGVNSTDFSYAEKELKFSEQHKKSLFSKTIKSSCPEVDEEKAWEEFKACSAAKTSSECHVVDCLTKTNKRRLFTQDPSLISAEVSELNTRVWTQGMFFGTFAILAFFLFKLTTIQWLVFTPALVGGLLASLLALVALILMIVNGAKLAKAKAALKQAQAAQLEGAL